MARGIKRKDSDENDQKTSKKPTSIGFTLYKEIKKKENNRTLVSEIIQEWEKFSDGEKEGYEQEAAQKGYSAAKKPRHSPKTTTLLGVIVAKSAAITAPHYAQMNVAKDFHESNDPRRISNESGMTEGESSVQPEDTSSPSSKPAETQIEMGFIEKDVKASHHVESHGNGGEKENQISGSIAGEEQKSTMNAANDKSESNDMEKDVSSSHSEKEKGKGKESSVSGEKMFGKGGKATRSSVRTAMAST